MEHKPIYLDGVNVSECKYLNKVVNEEPYCNIDEEHLYTCSSDENCYFKQLARKTQEFEQLQEKYEALKLENEEGYEIVDELKQECEELKEKLRELELKNTTLQNRNQQLDGSMAECEELKERIKCNCFDPKSNNNRCISYNRIAEDYKRDLKRLENKIAECEELKSESFTREELISIQEKDIDRYRKALEEIEKIVKKATELPCVFSCDCNNCAEKPTKHWDTCIQGAIYKIVDIIKKVKN